MNYLCYLSPCLSLPQSRTDGHRSRHGVSGVTWAQFHHTRGLSWLSVEVSIVSFHRGDRLQSDSEHCPTAADDSHTPRCGDGRIEETTMTDATHRQTIQTEAYSSTDDPTWPFVVVSGR